MRKLVAYAFVIGMAMSAVAEAQAMPLVPDRAPAGIVVQVAGGCGVGWHRGPYGGCRRNGGYVRPAPGPCFGRGSHRVCNGFGRCWRVCN